MLDLLEKQFFYTIWLNRSSDPGPLGHHMSPPMIITMVVTHILVSLGLQSYKEIYL